jgi:hypothetical protein
MRHPLSILLLTLSFGCDEAEDCGKAETCPVGTVVEEYRENREGFEISGEGSTDYTSYEGGLAYRRFENGTCEWACVAIQECPDFTFPVITEDCFTCGTVNDDGDLVQGDCGD